MTLPVSFGFENVNDFQGWTCGQLTTCGKWGKICGGHKAKGGGDYIQQTFMLPPGRTYEVNMDFIKIDSWFAL